MKRFSAVLSLALILGFLMPATASAVTDRITVPFNTRVVSCSGDRVRLSGELLLISHFTLDSSGGFHFHSSLVPRHVRGVSASGTQYKAVGGERETFNVSGHGTLIDTFTSQFMLISQGASDNLLIQSTFHITISPKGNVTAFVDNFSVRCVG